MAAPCCSRPRTLRCTTSTPTTPASPSATMAREQTLHCDVIAGCDGFHGVCRDAIPAGVLRGLRAGLSLRLARHPGRGAAGLARADLCAARARLRPRHHAEPPWRGTTSSAGRRRTSPTGPTTGSGPSCTPAWPTATALADQGGPDPAEGHHPDAQLRGGADAPRQAVPRRRRRAYRAADRRQGHEPGGRRHHRAGAGAGGLLPRHAAWRCWTPIPRPRCAASGRRSASPGG